jgi:hypothetical protein
LVGDRKGGWKTARDDDEEERCKQRSEAACLAGSSAPPTRNAIIKPSETQSAYNNPVVRLFATLVFCSTLVAQTFQVVPSTAPRGGTGSLLITLVSPEGKEPVALQWKILLGTEVTAAAEDIVVGEAAKTADKVLACALVAKPVQEGLTYKCILAGGVKPIANGTVFRVKYGVKQKTKTHTMGVRISDAIAVLQHSDQVLKVDVAPADGTITVP